MYKPQDTISMNSARRRAERSPEWVKEQKRKIKAGIEDDLTEEFQIDLQFQKIWEFIEEDEFDLEVDVDAI